MNVVQRVLLLLTCCLPLMAGAAESTPLDAFSKAVKGQQRHVIELPKLGKEEDYKVELIAGKTQTVDCNHHFLNGVLEEKNLEGWGYTYYLLERTGPPIATLMACPEGFEKSAFVSLGGAPLLVRYNSKLPIVIYTPDDIEVFYRIWSASDETLPAAVR